MQQASVPADAGVIRLPRGGEASTPPALSAVEKAAIKQLIDQGRPLPRRYRERLFDPPAQPELTWWGKPYRVEAAPASLRLHERYPGPPDGRDAAPVWRNRLVRGDNKSVLAALAHGPLRREIEAAGGLRLIYIDPPFSVGTAFPMHLAVGRGPDGREAARVRDLAYWDVWAGGPAAYLTMMYERLWLMRELLADDGVVFVHCDWHSNAPMRLMLDEIFGRERFVNEIVWYYYNKLSAANRCLPRAHDTILLYSKTGRHLLNPFRLPRDQPARQLVRRNVDGVLRNARGADGRLQYRVAHDRRGPDVWEIPQLQPASAHWTGYGTQKHHDLLGRILELCSREGDLVADFFAGSGTLPAAAEAMGRRWIACDHGRLAVHLARKRLLQGAFPAGGEDGASRGPRPFDVLVTREAAVADDAESDWLGPARLEAEAAMVQGRLRIRLTGFSRRGAPQADAKATARAHGWRRGERLAVEGGRLVRHRRRRGGAAVREVLTPHWSDWIDYWAVDLHPGRGPAPAGGPAPFHIDWAAWRDKRRRDLPLEAVPDGEAAAETPAVTVMAVDVFGHEVRCEVAVARD